jgi:hypothetical protein
MDGPPTDQLTLPLCHGGLGLAHTCPEEGDAAYLSVVATTQLAMRHGPTEFRPFDGPSGAQLCPQWEGLHDKAETLRRPEDLVVSQDSMETIAEAQRAYCGHSAQAPADALLASLHVGTEDSKRARARLLSCACCPASAWLDTLPLSRALELKTWSSRLPSDTASAIRPEARGDILMALPQSISITDISVIHPLSTNTLSRAATTAGAAASHRDQQKRTAYARVEPHGYGFVPFSVETYGRLGQPAMKLLHLLGDEVAGPGGVTRASLVNGALRELSVGLCRGDFLSYPASVGMLARSSGASFRAGMRVPTDECVE